MCLDFFQKYKCFEVGVGVQLNKRVPWAKCLFYLKISGNNDARQKVQRYFGCEF